MTLLFITYKNTYWQTLFAEEEQDFSTFSEVLSYAEELKQQGLSGGILASKEILIPTAAGKADAAQTLTETLNLPFVYGDTASFSEKAAEIPWLLTYHGYLPGKDEYSVESLLTVGNGFLGLRGTTPEMEIAEENYPATYLAGLYNTAASEVSGQTIYNEDFVNAPNLQKIYLIVDGEKIDIAANQVLSMKRQLELRTGLFQSWATIQLENGKQIAIQTKKSASMENVHQYSILYRFSPLNFSGEITLVSEADGSVFNSNVARYRSLTAHHLTITKKIAEKQRIFLEAVTKQSQITIRQSAELFSDSLDLAQLVTAETEEKATQRLTLAAEENQWYEIEKTVDVQLIHQPQNTKAETYNWPVLPRFNELYTESSNAWQELWQKAGITVEGDLMSQKMLNLHTYHLLTSASPNGNRELDASVTARGLHGEAYRGHIFWDELFILPFYIIHFPETARQLLLYRYQRLTKAKEAAQEAGYQGAMFPWQSGLDGSEQSQKLHLNPISGEWKEDHSRLQRHVSLAVAYNVWQYWHNTGDIDFMKKYGIEMLLEIAHFWQSAALWDEEDQRYSISGVMGPDEFHEGYPNADKGGLKNNAYTNMMVVWLFEEITKLAEILPEEDFQQAQNKTGVDDVLLADMLKIRKQLALSIDEDGIIAQFDGYFDLAEIDWDHYKETYGNIYRMDRILNAEGRSADDYKVAKQADSLMIFYNFSKAQVAEILDDLGYQLPKDYVEKNLHYYLQRTSHGSTLSRVVHAQLAAMVDDQQLAWQLYQEALYSDYRDIQGGTTAEGIHAGVMAATLFIPLTTFAGLDIRQEHVHFQPKMPEAWQKISFSMTIRGVAYQVAVSHDELEICANREIMITVAEKSVTLKANEPQTIYYKELLV